jgi:ATP-dependent Lon protease
MLMGNIPLDKQKLPISTRYFDNLPENFCESALLDRFHCFIEGWKLPRINTSMIFKGWTINVEYFSEIIHALRTQNIYSQLYDQLIDIAPHTDMRDAKAVKRMATAYIKLLFPHWRNIEDVDIREFEIFCLNPALHRRGIVKEQCHNIDPEFKSALTGISLKEM